ncbi:MAG TPA: TolC family protein [Bryobacteraceae bacterium]|jgi:outer membrane protein|nr:TolC family protein [Bryobacteraceae bacterium]
MNRKFARSRIALITGCVVLHAQQPVVENQQPPVVGIFNIEPPKVSPAITVNSERLRGLMRAGRLYLTLQDAIAAAIENNLDLQVDRYGPLRADWYITRQQGGGPLRGSTQNPGSVGITVSGQGVNGALSAAGLSTNNGGASASQNGGTITQIGTVTPNLDPTVYANTFRFSHITTPQASLAISGVQALVDDDRNIYPSFQEGFLTGGAVQAQLQYNYQKENSPGDVLRPSFLPAGYIYAQQPLLAGRGIAVNARFIHIAQKQAIGARLTFRSQLLNLVAAVVNAYWDLSGGQADLAARQSALEFAQRFYEDTRRQIQLGATAGVDIYRAEAEVTTRRQDLAVAQQTVSQQEIALKNLISRNGLGDPGLDSAAIVLLDRLEVPANEELPPLRQLVATAMAHRPDIQLDKINDEVSEISALGTQNSILPSLTSYGYVLNRGLAGFQSPISKYSAAPSQIGGNATALEQLFGGDYKSRYAGANFRGIIHNRSQQADFGIDQLQLRQGDLIEMKNHNDMVVAISNGAIAVRQAALRYHNAVATRELQQDLLDKEEQKFRLGSSTIDLVIAAGRTLISAQYAELDARTAYARARIGLDQTLGTTLETYHVSVDQALQGVVDTESKLPANLPAGGAK